ncbi:hypothetical protein [Nocardioides sp. AN3]
MTIGATACPEGEHEWVLRSVEFDDGEAVQLFECVTCSAVDIR